MGSLLVPLLVLGVVSQGDVHVERAVVADPRTGEVRAHRLPGGTLCYGPVFAVGQRVLFSGHRGGRPVALSLPLSLTGAPRSLGPADTITSSATPGRVWLGRWRPAGKRSRASLRELDVDSGRVMSRVRVRLPGWARLEGAFDDGFAVGHGRRLTLWNRGLDRPLHRVTDGWLVAAGGSRLAWCGGSCRRIGVWTGDGARVLRPPPGLRPQAGADAAFSPDGDRLAVPLSDRTGASRLAVVDLVDGGWTLVPGGRLGGYGAVAWSPLGGWLYFTGGSGDRLLAWAPGIARATRVPVDPGGTVMSIATSG